MSALKLAANASLSSIGRSPFADLQTAPCWVEISHDGRFLFTVNTASATISRYRIAAGGSLALIGSTPLRGPVGLTPTDERLSPDGTSLWVLDPGTDDVSGFAVFGGNLSEFGSSPVALPAGAAPAGIVVN